MARIAGVDIPRHKQAWVSLQYIYGIGPSQSQKILAQTGVNPQTRVNDSISSVLPRLAAIGAPVTAATCRSGGSGRGLMPVPSGVLVRRSLAVARNAAWPRSSISRG
jgi:hypothetical protein